MITQTGLSPVRLKGPAPRWGPLQSTEFAPGTAEHAPLLPGLSPIGGKPVQVAFDGGRLTSDAGILMPAEIERRLGLAERLARCIEDPRAPERVSTGWKTCPPRSSA